LGGVGAGEASVVASLAGFDHAVVEVADVADAIFIDGVEAAL